MREINEAWQVLQDPVRRRSYDDGVLGSRPVGPKWPKQSIRPTDEVDDDLVDVVPEMSGLQYGLFHHLPWVVLVVVFGLIFVVSAYAGSGAKKPADDPALRQPVAGDCVNVKAGPATTVVPCSGPYELKIVSRVDEATPCPAATERRRLGSDGLLDCVSPS